LVSHIAWTAERRFSHASKLSIFYVLSTGVQQRIDRKSAAFIEIPAGEELVIRKSGQRTGILMEISLAWQSYSLELACFIPFWAGGVLRESQLTHKNGLLHFC
jgi:hypothetical protein